MSTHLYNELEIKASHEDMRSLLRKVVNQSNNKFELKSDIWEADSAACHSWDDGEECNYDLSRYGDQMILRAEFNSKNVPPYYWAEKVAEQFPDIKFSLISSAFDSPNFLIRYSREGGLEGMKNYRLLINWYDCFEVETNENGQYYYIDSREPVEFTQIPKLIRVSKLKYCKDNLSYTDRLYVWLLKAYINKIKSILFYLKNNGIVNTWQDRKSIFKNLSRYVY
ncbi:hypothetical protein [Sediminibacterium salmoneum]|uniref:hypothetical protein n=1 Tax=Sediminibacterium salmoneum TaxID=426421 RepID=UPI00047ABAB4|nr:hypothetical protein [Sediminibacterium salmoneum]